MQPTAHSKVTHCFPSLGVGGHWVRSSVVEHLLCLFETRPGSQHRNTKSLGEDGTPAPSCSTLWSQGQMAQSATYHLKHISQEGSKVTHPNKPVDTCFTHGSWHHPLSPSLLKCRQRRAEHQGLSAFTRKHDGSKLRDPAKEKQFSLYSWAQTQH